MISLSLLLLWCYSIIITITLVQSKRLVIFAGPHKSASSTVQEFFCQYATGRPKYRKLSAFQGWRWPVLQKSRIPPRKQLSRLVYTRIKNDTLPDQLHQMIKETFQTFPNMVLGSEEFDRFGMAPWSHRNGIAVIEKIEQDLHPDVLDIVVNYRTPRRAQWISIWKQLTATDINMRGKPDQSYADWICHDERVWEYLDCVANPLGLVRELLRQNKHWNVTLLDMGGISKKGLDIAHVSACDILNVPCHQGWVKGIDRVLQHNVKRKPLEDVTLQQVAQMEEWFRLRDCAYQAELLLYKSKQQLTILHPDSLWQNCSSSSPRLAKQLLNTTWFLQLLQSQFNCQEDTTFNITKGMINTPTTPELNQHPIPSSTTDPNWVIVQSFQWTTILVLFGALFQFRRRRRRQRQRH